MSKLTLEQFKEEYEGSPVSVDEMANTVVHHLDPDDPHDSNARILFEAAEKLVAAHDSFLEIMGDLDIELG